jgi:alcohol dehydrogenase class IV
MPPRLTALTGFDALCQSIEPMMSTGASEITDALSIHALELISKNIRAACYQGQNLEARRAMSLGALMAGLAMNASLTYAHIFQGVLGPRYNLPHGLALITLPSIMEYNLPLCIDKLAKVAEAMGENISNLTLREAANRSILAVRQLMEDIELPCSLKDLGVPSEDLPFLQDKFLELPALNPRKITKEDAPKLLEKMWKGTFS